MVKHLMKLVLVACVWFTPHTARAGIPVIDVASLTQAIMDAATMIEQLAQLEAQLSTMKDTYDNAKKQYEAIKGARNLGDILNNKALQNYIPADARATLDKIQKGDYSGLSGTAKAMRDAVKLYDCSDILDSFARKDCEVTLNKPYQYQAFFDDGLKPAADRAAQINSLMERASSTEDAKDIAEVQARIMGETALLQHELSQVNLMRGLAEAEAKVAEAQAKERQRSRAARTGTLGGITGAP